MFQFFIGRLTYAEKIFPIVIPLSMRHYHQLELTADQPQTPKTNRNSL